MKHSNTAISLGITISLALLSAPSIGLAQWANSRGGPERDGLRNGTGDLPLPQVRWSHELGGTLGTSSLLQINDPVVPRIAITNGGRVELKRWDDSLAWQGQLLGLSKFLAAADLDGNGTTDILFASGGSVEATVVGYTPDGDAVFTGEPGLLNLITSGARVVDLDGDGFRELFLTSYRKGPDDLIAVAYRFPGGDVNRGELMYTINGSDRDYVAGFFDVIAELDGTPGLEILSLGHRELYVHDAATGALESTTTLSGVVPYSRATLRLVDLNLDGQHEVIAFSNQAWSEANNRRHVTLFAHSGGQINEIWTRDLGSDPNVRLQFSDSSVSDLDDDGELEVIISIRDGAGDWTTEVLDAATGTLLDALPDHRFDDVVTAPTGTVFFTHDMGTPLRSYRFDRSAGITALGLHRDLRLLRCRRDRDDVDEVPRHVPCRLPIAGVAQLGVLAGEYDPITNATTSLVVLNSRSVFAEAARFDGRGGTLTGVLEIQPGHPAVIAVAHSDGVLLPLDEKLRFLAPSPKPPFSWAGVRYGSRFSGTDLPSFPLVVNAANGGERIAALSGAGRATVLDATTDPSNVAGIETVWTAGSGSRLVVDNSADPSVVIVDPIGSITALSADDGSERWRVEDAFARERPLHNDPLVVRDDSVSPATNQLWFHRRNNNTGIYDLTAVDLATGDYLIEDPSLDSNDGGWKRLSLATWDGSPSPISGRLKESWRFDVDGGVAQRQPSGNASLIVPITRAGANPLFIVDGSNTLSAFDPETGQTLWQMDRKNSGVARHGATLNVGGRAKFTTTDTNVPILRTIDVETGNIDFSYHLVGGELVDPSEALPTPAPLLSNVTAITDLTGAGDPAYLAGSTDGFIYAIHALTGELIWALYVAAHVGEIVPADWDNDQLLELVASTADGRLLGIDRFTGNTPAWVHDTNGITTDDVDELVTQSSLFVAWAPVEGATAYEVAVFTNDNQPVTAGFADVGDRTELALTNLDLEVGTRYVVSVRAISSLGVSPDRPSDGVTVIELKPGDGGGCCQVGSDPMRGGLESLVLALVCIAFTWRRRRRSNR